MAILISVKIIFKFKYWQKGHNKIVYIYWQISQSIHLEYITIVKIHTTKIRSLKYIKQTLP
jgi:hypothetical protein